jgi:hypothetical protein
MNVPVRENSLGFGLNSRPDVSSSSWHSDECTQPVSLSDSRTLYQSPLLAITGNVAPLA